MLSEVRPWSTIILNYSVSLSLSLSLLLSVSPLPSPFSLSHSFLSSSSFLHSPSLPHVSHSKIHTKESPKELKLKLIISKSRAGPFSKTTHVSILTPDFRLQAWESINFHCSGPQPCSLCVVEVQELLLMLAVCRQSLACFSVFQSPWALYFQEQLWCLGPFLSDSDILCHRIFKTWFPGGHFLCYWYWRIHFIEELYSWTRLVLHTVVFSIGTDWICTIFKCNNKPYDEGILLYH